MVSCLFVGCPGKHYCAIFEAGVVIKMSRLSRRNQINVPSAVLEGKEMSCGAMVDLTSQYIAW